MKEIWKDIYFVENGVEYDYRGLYQVSDLGRIKSLLHGKEKILNAYTNKLGYYYVSLFKNKKEKKFRVHRLVAIMFIDNPKKRPYIDHINTLKTDNKVENLRWVTQRENARNPITLKRIQEKCGMPKKVRCIETGEIYNSAAEIQRKTGIWGKSIRECCKGNQKTAGGFQWEYAEIYI